MPKKSAHGVTSPRLRCLTAREFLLEASFPAVVFAAFRGRKARAESHFVGRWISKNALTHMLSHLSRRSALLMLASVVGSRAVAHAQWDPARRYGPPRATHRLQIGGGTLQVYFATGTLDL